MMITIPLVRETTRAVSLKESRVHSRVRLVRAFGVVGLEAFNNPQPIDRDEPTLLPFFRPNEISANIVPGIMGYWRKSSEDARRHLLRNLKSYSAARDLASLIGQRAAFDVHLEQLYQPCNKIEVNDMTFYKPEDSCAEFRCFPLSRTTGMFAIIGGISRDGSCILNINDFFNDVPSNHERFRVHAIASMAIWGATHSVHYFSKCDVTLTFMFDQERWNQIVSCLVNWDLGNVRVPSSAALQTAAALKTAPEHASVICQQVTQQAQEDPEQASRAFASFIAVDIETTGLDANTSEITEIAAVRYVDGVETDHFTELVKPCAPISSFIVKLTGIDDAMVADAEAIAEVFKRFVMFCGCEPILVAHNARFEAKFFAAVNRRVQVAFNPTYRCTLQLARATLNLRSNKLANVYESLIGTVSVGLHRALPDAMACAEIWMQMHRS